MKKIHDMVEKLYMRATDYSRCHFKNMVTNVEGQMNYRPYEIAQIHTQPLDIDIELGRAQPLLRRWLVNFD